MSEKISIKPPSGVEVKDFLYMVSEVVLGFTNRYNLVAEDVASNLVESVRVFGGDASTKCLLAHAEYLALCVRPDIANDPQFPTQELDYFIKSHFESRNRGRSPSPDEVALIRRRLPDY